MTQKEFLAWIEYYKNFPFDDYYRYHRPAALISATNGANVKDSLEWLQPEVYTGDFSQADINTFKAFGISPPKVKE